MGGGEDKRQTGFASNVNKFTVPLIEQQLGRTINIPDEEVLPAIVVKIAEGGAVGRIDRGVILLIGRPEVILSLQ